METNGLADLLNDITVQSQFLRNKIHNFRFFFRTKRNKELTEHRDSRKNYQREKVFLIRVLNN